MQHPRPAESRLRPAPRLRRLGRWLLIQTERLVLLREWVGRAFKPSHGVIGRSIVRWRLRLKAFADLRLFFAVVFLGAVSWWLFGVQPSSGSAGAVIASALFGTALLGAVAAVWLGAVRYPLIARRIRRRIVKRPESVLPTTSPHRQAELIARDEEMPIVPREDLYEEVLPGILDRRHSDIQMVVGEPGAGKTTALVGLAQRLAGLGIVPVVVPIMADIPENLVEAAESRFKRHAVSLVGSSERLDDVWRWLRAQRRIVVAIDDVDRIAPDGERGYWLRNALGELASANLPAVVTTRPAGIPAGLAASAVDLGKLDQKAAVDHVLRVAAAEPGTMARNFSAEKIRGSVEQWVREGKFAEVPFYLELLARLVAVGRCEELSPASAVVREGGGTSRARERADGECEWNPQWVRFHLLEHFHKEVVAGRVYRWLAIEPRERRSCLEALSEAALATLTATAMKARPSVGEEEQSGVKPKRSNVEEFLKSDDRAYFEDGGRIRKTISAHEVIDTGERLRILDRDPSGELHFHHRIMQAYLAGRCLAARHERSKRPRDDKWWRSHPPDWIAALLDPFFPDRLTAQMTLTFAALSASRGPWLRGRKGEPRGEEFIEGVLERLTQHAELALRRQRKPPGDKERAEEDDRRLNPSKSFHPELKRADPDDALAKLTTAAEIARATAASQATALGIVKYAREAHGATRWTKLQAIPSIAALEIPTGWECMWEFARSRDQEVRRAASEAIAGDAFAAYEALQAEIDKLLERAAYRSARGLTLDYAARSASHAGEEPGVDRESSIDGGKAWNEKDDVPSLWALGWILPAMVSGLREHGSDFSQDGSAVAGLDGGGPAVAGGALDAGGHPESVRGAREALERFVRLAFQGEHPELEASLAQGFKNDAMQHADAPKWGSGPGLVAYNRRFVADVCIDSADYWYARLVLHQALALYTIAGSSRQLAFDIFGRLLHRGREPHPFVWRTARLARRAVRRGAIGSDRWASLIWVDEGVAVSTRPTEMTREAAQLVADVTLLLNLRERAPEDRRAQFPQMRELPHCLSTSANRDEILGAGCPSRCGYGLCPLSQPPADEPNGQRTVSRAFCRGQHEIAFHHKPPWQRRHIRKRRLREFWRRMEVLARS